MTKLEGTYTYLARLEQEKAARRYAQANKSDPFALARAMTHIKNGVASTGDYDATDNGDGTFHSVKRV